MQNRGKVEIWTSCPRIANTPRSLKEKKYTMLMDEAVRFPNNIIVTAKEDHVTISSPNASYDVQEAALYGLNIGHNYPEGFKLFKILPAKGDLPSELIYVN